MAPRVAAELAGEGGAGRPTRAARWPGQEAGALASRARAPSGGFGRASELRV